MILLASAISIRVFKFNLVACLASGFESETLAQIDRMK